MKGLREGDYITHIEDLEVGDPANATALEEKRGQETIQVKLLREVENLER